MKFATLRTNLLLIVLVLLPVSATSGILLGEKHADGTASIKWTLPANFAVDSISVDVFEQSPRIYRGRFSLPANAHIWRSTLRETLFGIDGIFGARSFNQWGDPRVLTPGATYEFVFHFDGHLVDSLAPAKPISDSILLGARADELPPSRMGGLGNFAFVLLVSALVVVVLVGLPLVAITWVLGGIAPLLFSAIRGDRSVSEIVISLANIEKTRAFFLLYAFAALTAFVIKVKLPFVMAAAMEDREAEFLLTVVRHLSRMRIADWQLDRLEILRLAATELK